MAVTLEQTPRLELDASAKPERDRQLPVAGIALVVEAVGVALIVDHGGSAVWRTVRLLIVVVIAFLALALESRRGRWVRGTSLCVAGFLGLTTGIGIGLVHLAKGDADVTSITAVVVLGGGLVVLLAGVRALWRATPGWWRLLSLPVAFLLFEFVLIPLSMAIYATNLPPTALGTKTPENWGLSYENANFWTSDHVRLSAWYVPSRNGAALVVMHGSGSNKESVLPQASVLARQGYGVLMVDARGHGQSGGYGMDFGWWGDRDTSAAVSWLEARPDVRGGAIGVLGMSMGGEEAIGAAASDHRIRAVVTEGALWRGSMDDSWLPQTLLGFVDRGTLAVQTQVANLLTSAPEPNGLRESLVAIAPRRVLLIAGQPELRGDRSYRNASPSNVQLWELPDTPHTEGLTKHPQQWETRVVGFFNQTLLQP